MLRLEGMKLGSIALLALALSACGGGGDDDGGTPQPPPPTTFTVGGTVSGLNANSSVVLQNNGGNAVTVSSNTSFTFAALASGSAYNVTVSTQPTGQTCAVANGQGQNLSANVTTVAITCTTNTYTISGTVSGLDSNAAIVLQNNGANNVSRSGDGPFAFAAEVNHGDAYQVTVLTQPADQTCAVGANGSGTATADVNVAVTCTTNQNTIGGTVTGLGTGTVVLQNNLGDNLSLSGAATIPFTFATPLAAAAPYFVSVLMQPAGQTCTVTAGSGTANASITNVAVACVDNPASFTLNFTVTGLNGSLTLRKQQRLMDGTVIGPDDKAVTTDGNYSFATTVTNGNGFFDVSVLAQPAAQRCVVFNNLQPAIGDAALNVRVECTNGTAEFSVGGTITGLHAAGLVLFSDVNSTFVLPPSGATGFAFPRKLAPGTPVNMAIGLQPTGQTCIITDNQDTVGNSDIAPARITCVDNTTEPLVGTYSISDTQGLAGEDRFLLTLYPDGVYLMAARDDDPDCGQNNGNGVELGAYSYDSAAGTFAIVSNVVDTNGDCGVWSGEPSSFAAVQKTGVGQASVLTLTSPESTFTLTPVPSIANSLVGSFRLPFVYDVAIFGNDGHYTITTSNDPDSDETGVEYGCYTRTGTTAGTFTGESAPGVCPDFVDTNDDAGLFGPGDSDPVTLPYALTNPYLLGIDADDPQTILLRRVVPN